ncbi:MAG: MoxR family ATPase, partial [Planctomycetota bacterium]
LCHRLTYPTPQEERTVLMRNAKLGIRREGDGAVAKTEFDVLQNEPVGNREDLIRAMEAVQQIHVSETFADHVVQIVTATRHDDRLDFGCSPRAGIALIKASRARALIHGRDYVVPDDMFALAEDVMLHRIRLNYEALADGLTGSGVLQEILTSVNSTNPPQNGRVAPAKV